MILKLQNNFYFYFFIHIFILINITIFTMIPTVQLQILFHLLQYHVVKSKIKCFNMEIFIKEDDARVPTDILFFGL